jgi:hypothetical protein
LNSCGGGVGRQWMCAALSPLAAPRPHLGRKPKLGQVLVHHRRVGLDRQLRSCDASNSITRQMQAIVRALSHGHRHRYGKEPLAVQRRCHQGEKQAEIRDEQYAGRFRRRGTHPVLATTRTTRSGASVGHFDEVLRRWPAVLPHPERSDPQRGARRTPRASSPPPPPRPAMWTRRSCRRACPPPPRRPPPPTGIAGRTHGRTGRPAHQAAPCPRRRWDWRRVPAR